MSRALLITCEHATNRIPRAYVRLFSPHRIVVGPWGRARIGALLCDHWGYDLGALGTAKELRRALRVPIFSFPYSRLFLEADSYGTSSLFSNITSVLPSADRQRLRSAYWVPYVRTIDDHIRASLRTKRRVIHIASHSFTPAWKGVERPCDVGVLFDPKRKVEARFARELHRALQHRLPGYRVRMNFPYTGASEGLVTFFRKRFTDRQYVGIEIEVNNRHVRRLTRQGREIRTALAMCLREIAR